MASVLNEEQKAKQKAALKAFHANPDKPTSANVPRGSRALGTIRKNIKDLTPVAADIIKKSISGGLVRYIEVWLQSEVQKDTLDKNPTASLELIELDNGKEVEVLCYYAPPTKERTDTAKWVVTKDADLAKADQDAKIRDLERAMKEKKAKDEGAIPKDDPQEVAKKHASEVGLRVLNVSSTPPEPVRYPDEEEDDYEEEDEIEE
jgi:hypothetical protein